jgi:hypothetical protein
MMDLARARKAASKISSHTLTQRPSTQSHTPSQLLGSSSGAGLSELTPFDCPAPNGHQC